MLADMKTDYTDAVLRARNDSAEYQFSES